MSEELCLDSQKSNRFITSPVPLERRCGAHSAFYLTSTGYFIPLGAKRQGRLVYHSPPSRVQVKKGSRCVCTLSTTKRLNDVHREKFVLSYAVPFPVASYTTPKQPASCIQFSAGFGNSFEFSSWLSSSLSGILK
jgi:hypothetical protein